MPRQPSHSFDEKPPKSIKKFLNSPLTLRTLSLIGEGYRPVQIAEKLGVKDQNLYYYTHNLKELGCIDKQGDAKSGIRWIVTAKGAFILKEILRRRMGGYRSGYMPFRMHNAIFSFKVKSTSGIKITAQPMNNGMIRYDLAEGIELIASPNEWKSVLKIYSEPDYFTDYGQAIIKMYTEALEKAKKIAIQHSLEIQEEGKLITRPHMAFERDVGALFLAAQSTAEVSTEDGLGHAWFDSSHEMPELETDYSRYAYDYLLMPERIAKIEEQNRLILSRLGDSPFNQDHPVYADKD